MVKVVVNMNAPVEHIQASKPYDIATQLRKPSGPATTAIKTPS